MNTKKEYIKVCFEGKQEKTPLIYLRIFNKRVYVSINGYNYVKALSVYNSVKDCSSVGLWAYLGVSEQ